MTSIVIPYHPGRGGDTELKYCLKSIDKYLLNVRNIVLVGTKPDWWEHEFIPVVNDDRSVYKEWNICNKLLHACNSDLVTDDFLAVDDDHYLLRSYNADTFPDYYSSWPTVRRNDMYQQTIDNSIQSKLVGSKYFNIHCPIRYNKKKLAIAMSLLDWSVKCGYCIKSVYAYYQGLMGTPASDCKIKWQFPISELRNAINGREWFSTDDGARGLELNELLKELYD